MATAWSLLHPHFTALTRQPAMADLMNLNRKNKRTLFRIYACIIYKLDIRVFKTEIYGKSRRHCCLLSSNIYRVIQRQHKNAMYFVFYFH